MTKPTITDAYPSTKWGLFRYDATVFDDSTVLRGNWYRTQVDAQKILDKLKAELPLHLKQTIVIKEVAIQPADRYRTHQFAAIS